MKKFTLILAVFALVGFGTPLFATDLGTTVSGNSGCQYNQLGAESQEVASGDVQGEAPAEQGVTVEPAQPVIPNL